MSSTIDIFKNKIPSVVSGISYLPFKWSSDFEFKDDYPFKDYIDYYQNPIDVDDALYLENLDENPTIFSETNDDWKTNHEYAGFKPALTYSKGLLSNSHQYKTGDIDVGHLQEFLDVLSRNNIFVRVTSGVRPGATTSSGNRSRHDDGHAIDITPINGKTWDDLINKIKNNPEVLNYMVANNVGWLEEISEEDQKKYDATEANVHISIAGNRGYGEAPAINGRKKVFGI